MRFFGILPKLWFDKKSFVFQITLRSSAKEFYFIFSAVALYWGLFSLLADVYVVTSVY